MRWLCFLFIGVIVSCRHDSFIAADESFQISVPDYVYTGDSFFLSTQPVAWQLKPNIGIINNAGFYIAPSSILNDSQQVTISSLSPGMNPKTICLIRKNINDTSISFSRVIMPLMIANCNFSMCHGNGSDAGGVNLESYQSCILFVERYQPKQSLLYLSMIKTEPLRRMPPAGALHQYRIDYFKKWIEQGANNN